MPAIPEYNQFNLFHNSTSNKEETGGFQYRGNNLHQYRDIYQKISWKQIFRKLWIALKVPLIAAKYQFVMRIRHYYATRQLPWFRVALILLFAYVFFKKDLQFNINIGAPPTILSEGGNNKSSEMSMQSFAQNTKITTAKKQVSPTLISLPNEDVKAYINRFSKVALVEMEKFEIPASIKMGQALLASHAGKNSIALEINNHFTTNCQEGDDCQNFTIGNRSLNLKTYQSAWESWRDHSKLLSKAKYMHLRDYKNNYRKWAEGLVIAGYRSDHAYSEQLIRCIEKYELFRLDTIKENL